MEDNPALVDACSGPRDEPAVAVFLICTSQWSDHDVGHVRLAWLRQTLYVLRADLGRLGIPLWIAAAPRFADVPATLKEIAQATGAQSVSCNAEYPLNEQRRDEAARRLLSSAGVELRVHHGTVILPPGTVRTGDDRPYAVFTPFKRRWESLIGSGERTPLAPPPARRGSAADVPDPEPVMALLPDDLPSSEWPAGESAARQRLGKFIDSLLAGYHEDRDKPSAHGTSGLSPYLSIGALSPRTCFSMALPSLSSSPGAEQWISELIWREFYRHVVAQFPHVSRGEAFQVHMNGFPWREDRNALEAWQSGRTGYPLVDAAMRQLNNTGFMHNRLRMVSAMFLSKHLLIDWHEGERYFMNKLRDGDFASNNGGWQWSASTGTDAAPYVRIFNPTRQQKKFDTDGCFVGKWVPEVGGADYPPPIVDHAFARQRAIDAFKTYREAASRK